jgi:4-amino-4-deoxy-L-arabinose transferase-like glycosyltransferase
MFAVHIVAQADIPGSALPTWLTLAAGAIALIVLAAWSWIRRSPRTRAAALASIIPLAGVLMAGALYLATSAGGGDHDSENPVPLSEDVDVQLPTLSVTD